MNISPILPIDGVPEELVRVLNARFRDLSQSTTATTTTTPATTPLTTRDLPGGGYPVTSVAGKRGDVNLVASEVGAMDITGLDVQIAYASASLTLTNAEQDVVGATITLNRAGRYIIHAVFDMVEGGAGDVGQNLVGYLRADGATQSQVAIMFTTALNMRATIAQQWTYTPAAAGKIVKLRAAKLAGTGASTVSITHTSISALWIGP